MVEVISVSFHFLHLSLTASYYVSVLEASFPSAMIT